MISNNLHTILDKNFLFQTGKIKRSEQYNNRCRSIYIKKQTKYLLSKYFRFVFRQNKYGRSNNILNHNLKIYT